MKRIILLISFCSLIFAACSPEYIATPPMQVSASAPVAVATSVPLPTEAPAATPTSLSLTPAHQTVTASPSSTSSVSSEGSQTSSSAQEAVKKYLAAALGIDVSQISVVSDTEVEWPDSCLGVAQEGIMCSQIVTPGHLIVLQVNNLEYEFHTNEDGSQIQPATIALTWKRDGGVAGFCDGLTIYLSGEVSANNCKSDARNGNLSPNEMKQLETWITQFVQANLDASDPVGVSDRMTRQLVLYGDGSTQPTDANQQAMFNWAQALYQRLYK